MMKSFHTNNNILIAICINHKTKQIKLNKNYNKAPIAQINSLKFYEHFHFSFRTRKILTL